MHLFPESCLDDKSELIINTHKSASGMLIPNPWHTPKIRKIGLFAMYIIDTTMESLGISAEKDTSVRLIDPNPIYGTIINELSTLIQQYLNNKPREDRLEQFDKFYQLVQENCDDLNDIVYWTGLVPDIRALCTPSACLSWIYSVLVQGTKL